MENHLYNQTVFSKIDSLTPQWNKQWQPHIEEIAKSDNSRPKINRRFKRYLKHIQDIYTEKLEQLSQCITQWCAKFWANTSKLYLSNAKKYWNMESEHYVTSEVCKQPFETFQSDWNASVTILCEVFLCTIFRPIKTAKIKLFNFIDLSVVYHKAL